MGKILYLSVACDTDPDIAPHSGNGIQKEVWKGVSIGKANFQEALKHSEFSLKHGQLKVSWLLRADRQIYELYNDASFCFRRFENIWSNEIDLGNEIGWHPHLYCKEKSSGQWKPNLGSDDDPDILSECLTSLRQHVNITTVRTGWDYHSDRLMRFFYEKGLTVDASAIPGNSQTGQWFYDWQGTPRHPYYPSAADYRKPAESAEASLSIIEIPMLVSALPLPFHLMRFCKRNLMAIPGLGFSGYESSKWQGQIITRKPKAFSRAINQAVSYYSDSNCIFINTYFHSGELLAPGLLKKFFCNLNSISSLAERNGYDLISITLRDLAPVAKEWIKNYQRT